MSAEFSHPAPARPAACPFCGLLCEDLRVAAGNGSIGVLENGCGISRSMFAARSPPVSEPQVDGQRTAPEAAYARAASILRDSAQPLLLCAGADVAGVRALLELAEQVGGVVDHANSDALLRNLLALQDGGWMSTTLTEVRNRADFMIVAGSGALGRFPRFLERCFGDGEAMFVEGERELCFLGAIPDGMPQSVRRRASCLPVEPRDLAQVFGVLLALTAGRPPEHETVCGVALERLENLLARMRAARYGVLVWAAADLDFAHAELAVQSMCRLVQRLNLDRRFSVLPLGGSDGDLTFTQVATWQSGYPLRVSFASGTPEYDPVRFDHRRLLQRKEVDSLLFVGALGPRRPPDCAAPTIVLSPPGHDAPEAEVFIPVGVPGLHHAAHLYRADGVVAIRLHGLVESSLPTGAQVLAAIGRALAQ
jgi:formylmethanofuran dehydrogenase subunit B